MKAKAPPFQPLLYMRSLHSSNRTRRRAAAPTAVATHLARRAQERKPTPPLKIEVPRRKAVFEFAA